MAASGAGLALAHGVVVRRIEASAQHLDEVRHLVDGQPERAGADVLPPQTEYDEPVVVVPGDPERAVAASGVEVDRTRPRQRRSGLHASMMPLARRTAQGFGNWTGKSKRSCRRAPLSTRVGKAEEGDVAEPRRLTTTRSSVRAEWGAACDHLDLAVLAPSPLDMRFAGSVESLRRITIALIGLVAVTVFGTVGYLLLGFTLLEAVYQTVTTVATVGFREVQPLTTAGQLFTIVLIFVGVGTVLYNLSVILEAVTEGHLRQHLERRHMDKVIAGMKGHVIICGYGRVGRSAAEFLLASGHEVVVVDSAGDRLESLGPDVAHLCGDVTDDAVLRAAGIDRARAMIATLDTDADTVYVTLSARAIRPDLVIIARARTIDSKAKLLLAGASRAINPQRIGGRRMAAFALQPDVAEFLDVVMHDEDLDFRIQEVHVQPGSRLDGRSVGELAIRETTGALLLAIRRGAGLPFEPNPANGLVVPAGAVLIAQGTQAELDQLAALARA